MVLSPNRIGCGRPHEVMSRPSPVPAAAGVYGWHFDEDHCADLADGRLLGLELRRVGSGKRMTFCKAGEAELSQWMEENARVCWIEHDEPWSTESELFSQLDLPQSLDQNRVASVEVVYG